MIGKFIALIGGAQWVTATIEGKEELAFRIFGVTFGYYKDHSPILYNNVPIRPVVKREYGETIRPS